MFYRRFAILVVAYAFLFAGLFAYFGGGRRGYMCPVGPVECHAPEWVGLGLVTQAPQFYVAMFLVAVAVSWLVLNRRTRSA